MQTSVKLQEPFSYSAYYIIIILVLILIITIYFLVSRIQNGKSKKKVIQIKQVAPKDRDSIKQKYIEQLNKLEEKINKNEISTRDAYKELSSIIRFFVYELTGIQVQNYALKEIKELNMPILYELIKEYYTPEFARKYLGDIKSSIGKTRKVIEKWN